MSEAETIRGTLRAFASYLRRPQLLAPSGLRTSAARRSLAVLFVLQFTVLVLVVSPAILAWQAAFGLPNPTAFDNLSPLLMVLLTVLAAPVAEEILFRGWLTGRKRALWLFLCALAVAGLLVGSTMGLHPLAVGGLFILTLLAAPIGWFLLRKKAEPPRWFAKGFPAIYYLVVIGFALPHLTNYPQITPLLIPMVLPQAWIGLVLGYIRMRIGLIGAILAHMASNGLALALAQLAGL